VSTPETSSENDLLKIRDLRLIRLARNAHILKQRPARDPFKVTGNAATEQFYLFDYFDSMTYVRDNKLSASDCFGMSGGINQGTMPATSAQLITLVDFKEFDPSARETDPFESKDKKRPFLSLLFVSLNTKLSGGPVYNGASMDGFQQCSEQDDTVPGGLRIVHDFLKACNADILAATESAVESIAEDGKLKPIYHLFQAINFGDFCLAVRSALPEHAHRISVTITEASKASLPQSEIHTQVNLDYSVYTVSGLIYGDKKRAYPFDSGFVRDMISAESHVMLRLRMDPRSLDKYKNFFSCNPSTFNTRGRGMFGWYDISIGVSIRQFILLYPILRAIKLDGKPPELDDDIWNNVEVNIRKKLEDKDKCKGCANQLRDWKKSNGTAGLDIKEILVGMKQDKCKGCINQLRDWMEDNGVADHDPKEILAVVEQDYCQSCTLQLLYGLKGNDFTYINERLAIGVNKPDASSCPPKWELLDNVPEQADHELIANRIDDLKKRIYAFIQKEYQFPYESEQFRERMRQFNDLRKTFAHLWYQRESRLNGTYFMVLCELALQGIEFYVDGLEKYRRIYPPDKEQSIMHELNENIEFFVRATNSFNKLTQSINFSSIQSPNYEIESRVDMEKYLVAYSEHLRSLSASFYSENDERLLGNPDACNHVRTFPFLYMDHGLGNISQSTLFNSLSGMKDCFPEKHHTRLIAVGIPSSAMLAKSYNVIPLLTHEISHVFRWHDKEGRNRLLLRLSLEKLTHRLIKQWLKGSDSRSYYGALNEIELVIQETLVQAVIDYFDSVISFKEDGKTVLFHYTGMTMESFLDFLKAALLAMFDDDDEIPVVQTPQTVIEHLKALLTLANPAVRREQEGWQAKIETIEAACKDMNDIKRFETCVGHEYLHRLQKELADAGRHKAEAFPLAPQRIVEHLKVLLAAAKSESSAKPEYKAKLTDWQAEIEWIEERIKKWIEKVCKAADNMKSFETYVGHAWVSKLIREFIVASRLGAEQAMMRRLKSTKSVQVWTVQIEKKSEVKIGHTRALELFEEKLRSEEKKYGKERKLRQEVFRYPPDIIKDDLKRHKKAFETHIAALLGLEKDLPQDVRTRIADVLGLKKCEKLPRDVQTTIAEALGLNLPQDVQAALNTYMQDLWEINFRAYNATIPPYGHESRTDNEQMGFAAEHLAFKGAKNEIAPKTWQELKKRFLEILNNKNDPLYTRLHARSGMQIINRFGILAQDHTAFLEGFERSKAGISTRILKGAIEFSFQVYREICADIGMCQMLKLNQLGYLRVLARGLLDSELGGMFDGRITFFDRASVVLAMLYDGEMTKTDGTKDCEDLKQLYGEVETYINSSMNYYAMKYRAGREMLLVRSEIHGDGLFKLLEETGKMLVDLLQGQVPIQHGSFPAFAEQCGLTDYVRKVEEKAENEAKKGKTEEMKALPACNTLMLDVREIYTIIYVLQQVSIGGGKLRPHPETLKEQQRISDIFYDYEKKRYRWDQNHEGEFWMREISDYYNKPQRINDITEEGLLHADRLFKSLRFVLYYYYRNRLLLSQSFSDNRYIDEKDRNGKWETEPRRKWLTRFTETKAEGGV